MQGLPAPVGSSALDPQARVDVEAPDRMGPERLPRQLAFDLGQAIDVVALKAAAQRRAPQAWGRRLRRAGTVVERQQDAAPKRHDDGLVGLAEHARAAFLGRRASLTVCRWRDLAAVPGFTPQVPLNAAIDACDRRPAARAAGVLAAPPCAWLSPRVTARPCACPEGARAFSDHSKSYPAAWK